MSVNLSHVLVERVAAAWMDAGAPTDVMSMALAKTVEAHGMKKRKHPAETTTDKLKVIALSKAPSLWSLIKQVQVISLLDDLFLDLDRVFHLTRSASTSSTTFWVILHVIFVCQMTVLNSSFDQNMREVDTDFL